MAFGDCLRSLRSNHKITQQDLADKIGVGRTTITEYESGRVAPPYEKMKKIAEIFNVSVELLNYAKEDISEELEGIIFHLRFDELKLDGKYINQNTKNYIKQNLEVLLISARQLNK